MGLNVVAVDLGDEKLELAKQLGADLVVNPKHDDAAQWIKEKVGGVHAAVVTAVSKAAFESATKPFVAVVLAYSSDYRRKKCLSQFSIRY
ncbi:Alcohol dehydrogenase [Anoxybacillus sp. BCO1]|nr:Alcohol dehydrogenase [Anoxybacillus sp. BCO1]